jgi:NAD(P)-dependent dehydrogenase (short-subunit alcohol dehydrogenase family)
MRVNVGAATRRLRTRFYTFPERDVQMLAEGIKDRPIEVLINNAGFSTYGAFASADSNRSADEVAVDVDALVQLTHAVLPGMVERGSGSVLNVASTCAFQRRTLGHGGPPGCERRARGSRCLTPVPYCSQQNPADELAMAAVDSSPLPAVVRRQDALDRTDRGSQARRTPYLAISKGPGIRWSTVANALEERWLVEPPT